MYKILGGDGKEYGPVSEAELRQWLSEGRANAETQVQSEGSHDWQALGTLPQFSDLRPAQSPSATFAGTTAPDAAARIIAPAAWALMATGILGVLWNLGQCVWYAVRGADSNPYLQRILAQNPAASEATMLGFKAGIVGSLILGVALAAFVVYAGNRMRQLNSWGMALTAGILALLPCCGSSFPVCILSFPVGVWVIVVLSMKKASFQ
jgi:hypothetical protein